MRFFRVLMVLLWAGTALHSAEIGPNDMRLTDMGPGNEPGGIFDFHGARPSLAYNSVENEYLIVFQGVDNLPGLSNQELEIWGQRVDAATGLQVGANDFRISTSGPDGDLDFVPSQAEVAYNPFHNEYLVVWQERRHFSKTVILYQIYARRIDGATGALLGDRVKVSDLRNGPAGEAFDPAVAYNSSENEYLVVFYGDQMLPFPDNIGREIHVQRLDGSTGQEIGGGTDIRITDTAATHVLDPDVAYNSVDNQYLVVWRSDVEGPSAADVYGQLLDHEANEIGADDFRISDMGPDGDADFSVPTDPRVIFNPDLEQYFVVWPGNEIFAPPFVHETEIFGQILDASGTEIGVNDFQISDMGADEFYNGLRADPVYNAEASEYLVVWYGDDDQGGLANGEWEAWGQRLDSATGAEIGDDDFRISDVGIDGLLSTGAFSPEVEVNPNGEYFVVWYGGEETPPLGNGEVEVFGQRLAFDRVTVASVGACPGTMTLEIGGLTPNSSGRVYSAVGVGSTAIASGSCAGTLLGLDNAVALDNVHADANGVATLNRTTSANLCSRLFQVIDRTSCEVSNLTPLQ